MDDHSSGTFVAKCFAQPTRAVKPDTALEFPPHHPYSVLLRVGFAWPSSVAGAAVRSCRTFSPLPKIGGLFLWHFPWGCPRRALPGTLYPWSPDFPPPLPFGNYGGGHPANWQSGVRRKGPPRQLWRFTLLQFDICSPCEVLPAACSPRVGEPRK